MLVSIMGVYKHFNKALANNSNYKERSYTTYRSPTLVMVFSMLLHGTLFELAMRETPAVFCAT